MICITGKSEEAETTTFSAVHDDIIQAHILTRLDGAALASAASTCSQLNPLCSNEHLWANMCHSTWPSTKTERVQQVISTFPNGSRSFFADSFSSHHQRDITLRNSGQTLSLISAVDIFHSKSLVFSKVVETETVTRWFRCSPFRVDLLDNKDLIKYPVGGDDNLGEELRLSWILIDPVSQRAMNVSSGKAVEVVQRSGEVKLRFATVVYGETSTATEVALCSVVVILAEENMEVREVSLQVEDMDGKHVSGRDSLVILHKALEGWRKWKGTGEEEGYREFVKKKKEREERKKMTQRRLDMMCLLMGLASLTFIALFDL